jgi:hypothetical protein
MSETYGPAIVAHRPPALRADAGHCAAPALRGAPAVSRTFQHHTAGSIAIVVSAIERLEEVVEQETAALKGEQPGDLRDFNMRKSHGLLELMRATRNIDGAAAPAIGARLQSLRAKLERNSRVLQTHLAAVQDVSRIIANALNEAESDGTYAQARRLAG